MKRKKILIVTASIGTGHTQAARAIDEYIGLAFPDMESEYVDFLSDDVLSIDTIVKETYIKLLDFFPLAYDLLYHVSQGRKKKGSFIQTVMAWLLRKRMLRLVREKRPDMLVFTHPFPCGAACLLKRRGLIKVPVIGVITDFAIHQFWMYGQVDAYCVATQRLADELVSYGMERERIHVTGIPVRRSFFSGPSAAEPKGQGNTVLVMGGGLGLGSLQKALQRMDSIDAVDNFIIVAGHNAALYEDLVQMKEALRHPIEIYGYTNEIARLMERSVLLVTKPGALTCTEAMAKQMPMVFFNAIPGQEEENARYLEQLGCARWARDIDNLDDVVTALLAQPNRMREMAKSCLVHRIDGACNVGGQVQRLFDQGLEEKEQVVTANTVMENGYGRE